MPKNLMLLNKVIQTDKNKHSYQRIEGIKQQLSKGYHHKTSVFKKCSKKKMHTTTMSFLP